MCDRMCPDLGSVSTCVNVVGVSVGWRVLCGKGCGDRAEAG